MSNARLGHANESESMEEVSEAKKRKLELDTETNTDALSPREIVDIGPGHTDIRQDSESLSLWTAACCGDVEKCKFILKNQKDSVALGIQSSLFIAASYGHTEICELLLEHNVSEDLEDTDRSPLWIATQNGHKDICQLLLKYYMERNIKCLYRHALWSAVVNGHTDISRMLLEYCANLNLPSNLTNENEAQVKTDLGHPDKVLSKAEYIALTSGANQLLLLAAERGYSDICKLLIDCHAHVDFCKHDQQTALWKAAKCGHTDTCKMLLENKADVNLRDDIGQSSLYIAAEKRRYKNMQHLTTVEC